MIYNCDDYEQVLKVEEKISQTIQERQRTLNYEDRLIFSQFKEHYSISLGGQQYYIPIQILNQYNKARIVIQQQFQRNQSNLQNDEPYIQSGKSIEEEFNSSDTQSLSIISDQQQFNLYEQQLQWQQILSQYGTLFKEFTNDIVIKTNQYLDYYFNFNKYAQQKQSYNNKVYLGLLIQTKEWIVVKEQELQNQSLIDAAQQFVIHNYIYQLYPTKFFKLWQPVFIQIDNEKLKFKSFSEQGLIDLYQYSQQKQIRDLELQLIFQQIFQQIQLLHKHNIAHRDIKPQNIIYVENKGWVLCDFENSQKYNQAYGVYDIKGTFAFLMPQLKLNSKIQGIQMKQNLLQNDLYAFAITLIVIKYQIKSQEQIDYYINQPKDPIIEVLLQSVSLEELHKYIIKNYEIRFIRPQVIQKQKDQQTQNHQEQIIIKFIIIVGRLTQRQLISIQCRIQYLNQIDEILKQNNNYLNYLHIFCYYEIPQYVNQLKYIIKYKELRQRNYWKTLFYKLLFKNNKEEILNIINFMYNIGLRDLFLYYAQKYIKIRYDFSIHILILYLLQIFYSYEELQNQFNILLKHRDFYQMNQREQKFFIEYTVSCCYEYLTQQEIKYFKSLGIKFSYANSMEILVNHYYDDRFFEKIISYIEKIMNQEDAPVLAKFEIVELLINGVIAVKNLYESLKLLELLKQKIKFQCPTVEWQDLLRMITQFNELLRFNNNKKLIKMMNYVSIFNSESSLQQDLLKFYKHQIQIYCNSKRKSFKIKIIYKIYRWIRNISKCSNKFYQLKTMGDLLHLITDAFYSKLLFEIFLILVYVSKQKELLNLLPQLYQEEIQKVIILCYKDTKNQKRVQKLVTQDKLFIISNQRNLIKYNQFEMMSYQFHFNQYLCR